MSDTARTVAGISLLTIPFIMYGGYFLLGIITRRNNGLVSQLQHDFYRAGHAHAGVLVILSLVCQVLADSSHLPSPLTGIARTSIALAPAFIPAGFFLSVTSPNQTKPTRVIWLIYIGIASLAIGTILLGIGLLAPR
ncbi:MAG: hypothetical protein ABI947_12940 [Chloroflexota bacterium]